MVVVTLEMRTQTHINICEKRSYSDNSLGNNRQRNSPFEKFLVRIIQTSCPRELKGV